MNLVNRIIHVSNDPELPMQPEIDIKSIKGNDMEFDLIHVDASFANALRRIMIAEIPTMAIETVYIMNNTSVIQDEVLAHRLGLIPIKANPDLFNWFQKPDLKRSSYMSTTGVSIDTDSSDMKSKQPSDLDTLVFSMKVTCTKNFNVAEKTTDPKLLYNNSTICAKDLIWEPQGAQQEKFADSPAEPVHPDVLIVKLRPGQEIDLKAHCQLGIGADHAKYSPVSTASYRLHPSIEILKPIKGENALLLQKCFSKGVIGIDKSNSAYIIDPRHDTVSRECLRHEQFKDTIKIGRIRDHFIFTIESVGSIPPDEIFLKSLRILQDKCYEVKNALLEQIKNIQS